MMFFQYIEILAGVTATIAGLMYYKVRKKYFKMLLACILLTFAEMRWILYYHDTISTFDDILWTTIEFLFLISAIEVFFNESNTRKTP